MDIKFEKAPTEVFIKNIGDRSDSKRPGYFVYHDAETHEGELITVLCHGVYEPTTQFVKGVIAGKTFHFPLPTYHKLKGSAAPDKPAQDAKYTGGQPAQQPQQADEKPKDYPWAPKGSLAEGEHTQTIEVMAVAPQMKDGVHRSYTNPKSGTTSWKYDVLYAHDGLKRRATWESPSQSDPMLAAGQHQMVVVVKGDFISIKKPKSGGGGFGGGSAPADPVLVLLAGIVSNPNIKPDDWELNLLKATNTLNAVKLSLSKLTGGSK